MTEYFHQAIRELIEQHKECCLTLESFLLSTVAAAGGLRESAELSLTELHELLASAFTSAPIDVNEVWRKNYAELDEDAAGYAGWEARVIRQIVELREMSESGASKNEFAYFGIESTRGRDWYNFDPLTYLECANAGWRSYWSRRGGDVEPSPGVSWESVTEFFTLGRVYE